MFDGMREIVFHFLRVKKRARLAKPKEIGNYKTQVSDLKW